MKCFVFVRTLFSHLEYRLQTTDYTRNMANLIVDREQIQSHKIRRRNKIKLTTMEMFDLALTISLFVFHTTNKAIIFFSMLSLSICRWLITKCSRYTYRYFWIERLHRMGSMKWNETENADCCFLNLYLMFIIIFDRKKMRKKKKHFHDFFRRTNLGLWYEIWFNWNWQNVDWYIIEWIFH